MPDKPVKCRDCKVDAKILMEDDRPKRVVCPGCGAWEDFDVFERALAQQAEAFAAEEMQKALSGMATLDEGGMFGVSVGYTPAKIDQATGKFVVDFD